MEHLKASNILMLPGELTHQAPISHQQEEFKKASCFDQEENQEGVDQLGKLISIQRSDRTLEQALITAGIGERQCPTPDEWATFSVAGGVIAALSKKYIVPPEPEPMGWVADLERFTWEALWQAFQENQTKLDRRFMATALRSFLPKEHYAPPDHPYLKSYFATHWGVRGVGYPADTWTSVSYIRPELLREGREALALLPEDTVASIHKVAPYIPTMLEIAIKRIRKTYLW